MSIPISSMNFKRVLKYEPEGRLRDRFRDSVDDLSNLLIGLSGDPAWMTSHFNLALKAIRVIPRTEVNSQNTKRFLNVLNRAGLLSWKKDGVRALLANEIRYGHNLMIQQLLEKTADEEYLPKLLFEESYRGHVKVVDKIIEMGLVDVNAEGEDGETVLHNAAAYGDVALIQNLLRHGADIRKKNHAGTTAVDLAIKNGRIEAAEILVGMPIIEWAVKNGRRSELTRLVEFGADPNAKNSQGYTIAHIAAQEGDLELLKKLAGVGTDFEKSDNEGLRVAHWLVINQHEHILAFLKEHSVSIISQDYEGMTPVHYAAKEGNCKAMEELLSEASELEIRDTHGRTALHYAAIEGKESVARLLINLGAELNPKDRYQTTPLHMASVHPQPETCAFLLDAGADVAAKDESGCSPLHYACDGGKPATILRLIEKGADFYNPDVSGNYPFEFLNIPPERQAEWIECLRDLPHKVQNNFLNLWEESDSENLTEEFLAMNLVHPIQGVITLGSPEYRDLLLENLYKLPKEDLAWAVRSLELRREITDLKGSFEKMPPLGKLKVVAAMSMEEVEPFLREVQEHLFHKIGKNNQYQNIISSVEKLSSMLSHGISTPQYQEAAVKQYNSLSEQYHNFVEYLQPWSELAQNGYLEPRVKDTVERVVKEMDDLQGEIKSFPSRLSANALNLYNIEDFGIGKVIHFIEQFGGRILQNTYVRRKDWNLSGVDLPKSLTKTRDGQWVVHLKSKHARYGGKLWGTGGYKKVKAAMIFDSSLSNLFPLVSGTITLNSDIWRSDVRARVRKNTEREVNFGKELKGEKGIVGIHSMTEYRAGRDVKIGVISDLYDRGDLLDNAFRFSQKEKGRILSNCIEGMVTLEERGIRHRDIKPENILIRTDEHQKLEGALGDFGLAVRLDESKEEIERRSRIGGTCRYLAPEVVRDPRNLNKQDIFAMGWTMYIAHYPGERTFWDLFNGKKDLEILRTLSQIHSNPLVNSTSENFHNYVIRPLSNDPDPLRRLIAKCLHPDPRIRPNARELLTEYQQCLNEKSIDIS